MSFQHFEQRFVGVFQNAHGRNPHILPGILQWASAGTLPDRFAHIQLNLVNYRGPSCGIDAPSASVLDDSVTNDMNTGIFTVQFVDAKRFLNISVPPRFRDLTSISFVRAANA